MKKEEYLQKLEAALQAVPNSEKQEIMDYFAEYADDLGKEGDLLTELGHPVDLAKDLLNNLEIDLTSSNPALLLNEEEFPIIEKPITYMLNQVTESRSAIQAQKKQIAPFSKIQFDLPALDLLILTSHDEQFYYSYNDKEDIYSLDIELVGDLLFLNSREKQARQSFFGFTFQFSKWSFSNLPRLILYIPKNHSLLHLAGKLGSGDLLLDGINSQQVELQILDGDCNIKNCIFHSCHLTNKNGDLDVVNSALGKGELDSKNGDFSFHQTRISEQTLTNSNGDFQFHHSLLEESQIFLANGDLDASNLGLKGEIRVQSSNGDLNLQLSPEQVQQINIAAQITCGDFYINQKEISETFYQQNVSNPQASLNIKNSNGDTYLKLI